MPLAPELEDFRHKMVAHAKLVASRAPKVDNEAKTNASLVQPFLGVLGYDVTNPDEVSLEHHADFSDKYQNKVDYAILNNGKPVIAVESKRYGAQMKDDRGQLKSYFNASPTVKLGVLTDGIHFEFYADSDKPNMMDDAPFFKIDFEEVAKTGSIEENALNGLAAIRNGSFNPEHVGAEARRKILLDAIVELIKSFKTVPSDDFVRFVLTAVNSGGKGAKITQRVVDTNRELVASAVQAFVAQEGLARFGFAPRDVIKTPAAPEQAAAAPAPAVSDPEPDLQPTEVELRVLAFAKNRLYFLAKTESMFSEIEKIAFRKSKNSFRVFYGTPNKGSLFDCRLQKDKVMLTFPAMSDKELPFVFSKDLDDALLSAFTQRFTGSQSSFDGAPVLRAIPGGQAG